MINEEVCGHYENREKDNEKGSPKHESENANKLKNNPKLNVDEQQDAKKIKRILGHR